MANAVYPDDTKLPPPYEFHAATNSDVSYQQAQPPSYTSIYAPQPPPTSNPVYMPSPPASKPVYMQPPPTSNAVYMQSSSSVVLPPMTGLPVLGHNPVPLQCPRCHRQIVTNVQYEVGGGACLISLLICVFGGIFGCCLIPFCVSSCQDAVHTCPLCRSFIGRRNLF